MEATKRGRKKMSDEEKAAAKLKRAEKKNEPKEVIASDADAMFGIVQDLQKQIKKNIDKLSASDFNRLKSLLNASAMQVDITLADKIAKEKAIKKAKLEKELEAIQKELSAL